MPRIRYLPDEEPSVQLSDLLERLSPDDRATVIERRLGPNAVPLDNRALANHLGNVRETGAALTQLNAGQLLLLRWLVERPGLRATWSELNAALGDRLSLEQRDAYLEDMRLWALADFDPSPRNGFFATYPAVATALPSGRNVHLRPQLETLNSDVLARICVSLGHEKPPTRKEDRLSLLISTLSESKSVRAAVERLSQPAQELFAWVREQGGWVDGQPMAQRVPRSGLSYENGYGTSLTFWRAETRQTQVSPLTELLRCRLLLPVSQYQSSWYPPAGYAIATEVERAFSGREILDSGPLQAPPVQPAEPVDVAVPNPVNLLRDIGHLLGFIGAGRAEWHQDGGPYKRSLVALGKMLGYKDGTYAEMLWSLAESAELIRRTFTDMQSRYEPVPIEELTPHDLFHGLMLAWVESGGAPSEAGASSPREQAAQTRLLLLLRLFPPDTWMLRSSIERLLRFEWPMLFAPEYQYPGAPPPAPGWSSLGTMLLAHGVTADGQPAVMLPAAHQQLIGPEPGEVSAVLPPWESSWIVQPDRTLVVPPNASPDTLVDLWKIAQLQSSQGASVFRVTTDSIAAALNRGLTPTQVREILQRGSRTPLPPTVERLIDDQGQKYGRIKVGTAQTYVRTDDPALLEELRRHKKLGKLVWREVAPGVAFVVSHDPDAVLTSLKQAGYLPVMEQAKSDKTPAWASEQRPGLRAVGGRGRRRKQPPLDRPGMERLISRALDQELSLTVTWHEGGVPFVAEVEPLDLHEDALHAFNLEDGAQEILIPLTSIVEMIAGDPLDEEWS